MESRSYGSGRAPRRLDFINVGVERASGEWPGRGRRPFCGSREDTSARLRRWKVKDV